MGTIATQANAVDSHFSKPRAVFHHVSVPRVPLVSLPSAPVTRLQRRASCVCGGSCPRCEGQQFVQAKLKANPLGHGLELEADHTAEEMMASQARAILQRKSIRAGDTACSQCDEDQEKLQRQTGQISDTIGGSVSGSFVEGLGSGQPLDAATRAFMERR